MRRNLRPSICDEGRGGGLRVVPVALEELRAAATGSRRSRRAQRSQRVGIDHDRLGVEGRDAQALLAQVAGRIHVRLGDGLGHPVGFHVLHAGELEELLRHGFGHRRAAAEDVLQRRQIAARGVRMRQQVDHHGRHVGPVGHGIALDHVGGCRRIPARQQRHRAAGAEDRRVQAVLHAGDVEHGRRGEHHRVGGHAFPRCAPPTAVHMMVWWVCMQPFGLPVVPEV